MISQTRTKIITIEILPNIKRSKGNHTMKFDQLIKHNKRNIFLEKSCAKSSEETGPRHFFETSILSKLLDQQSEVLYSLFLYVQVEDCQNIFRLSC